MVRDCISGSVFYSMYVDHTEAIAECIFLEVSQACVRYLIERPVAEDL